MRSAGWSVKVNSVSSESLASAVPAWPNRGWCGRDLDAEEALTIGFVERLATKETLDENLRGWIDMILACAPEAVRSQKRVMRGWESDDTTGIDASIQAFSDAYRTDEPASYLAPVTGKPR